MSSSPQRDQIIHDTLHKALDEVRDKYKITTIDVLGHLTMLLLNEYSQMHDAMTDDEDDDHGDDWKDGATP